jgi:hypothetical protein
MSKLEIQIGDIVNVVKALQLIIQNNLLSPEDLKKVQPSLERLVDIFTQLEQN